ncbi:MAG TPA: HIT family protein [Candidatus Kapabacteria bacterium]|jgi:diadenosine tetraphosphate (Ap4A) HIT family hydrolase
MHQDDCLFCKLIRGEIQCRTVYEDAHHVAFLTPFPNTPGFTVLATREHQPSYIPSLAETRYTELMASARTVALLLDRRLGTKRTGIVAEGMGIDHAHVKLIPMYGIPDGPWQAILSNSPEYSEQYKGYLTTNDGPRMSDSELSRIQSLIQTNA